MRPQPNRGTLVENVNLDRLINGMSCRAELPTGIRATMPERLANITFRQALMFLAQIVQHGFGTFSLEHRDGCLRLRSWSSSDLVETELWHAQSGRSWTANLSPPLAKAVVLTCPDLHAVFSHMQTSASDFHEITL